jgi:hypothetical protein
MIDAASPIAQQDSNNLMQSAMADQNLRQEQELIGTKAFANMRGQYLDSHTSVVNEANINISEIQSNADIPASEKQKMITQQIDMRNADLEAMQLLFQNTPMWEQNWNSI